MKPDRLKDAIRAAATDAAPIALLVKTNNQFRTVTIDYRGGLKYPHLERIPGAPDRLGDILTPRGPGGSRRGRLALR